MHGEETERRLCEKAGIGGNLWVAPLPISNHRLVHWHKAPHEGVLQIETLQNRDGLLHARIYLSPTETHIPTIVIGHPSVVAVYAWRDHKSAHPLRHNMSTPCIDTELIWPDDFSWLPNKQSMNGGKTMYYVRPTSFVLTDVYFVSHGDIPVKIKRFTNMFDGTEFSHITSSNEWDEIFPAMAVHGLVVTNSPTYVKAHAEYAFASLEGDKVV